MNSKNGPHCFREGVITKTEMDEMIKKLKEDMLKLKQKLEEDRKKQEEKLHKDLSARKKAKMEAKVGSYMICLLG
jgi:hypothetical protein